MNILQVIEILKVWVCCMIPGPGQINSNQVLQLIFKNKFLFWILQVLIPVFALGRAQELCILLESYWDRMNIKVPIYFSLGLTEKVGII